MSSHAAEQIRAVEERLRVAMLASDCGVLDELIADELIFTNHLGHAFEKADDLQVHRSGVLKFHLLESSEMRVRANAQIAVVSVRMKVAGTYGGSPFSDDLRYTRVWRLSVDGRWEILAGHSSRVA